MYMDSCYGRWITSLPDNIGCLCCTGAEIDQIKKNYVESQSRRNSKLKGLGDELHGVHKVMFENIDAVLQRGELISGKLEEVG